MSSGYVYKSPADYDYPETKGVAVGGTAALVSKDGSQYAYDRSDYGHSSYGHSSQGHHGGGYKECCPLVVDPLTFFSLLAAIAGSTAFLNTIITMAPAPFGGGKRRKRSDGGGGGGEDDEDDDLGVVEVDESTFYREKLVDVINAGRREKSSFPRTRLIPRRDFTFCIRL